MKSKSNICKSKKNKKKKRRRRRGGGEDYDNDVNWNIRGYWQGMHSVTKELTILQLRDTSSLKIVQGKGVDLSNIGKWGFDGKL